MFDPEQQDSSQSASSPMALARGAACLPCRRRKMRCDGKKPVCSPCIAKDRQEDCEYTGDIQGLTKTQLLEENISLLEARISELENPSEATSVKLRDVPGPSAVPLTLMIPGSSNVAPSGPAPGPSAVPASASVSEPTVQDVHNMINNFIPCASKVGFFLNTTRFIQLAYLPVDQRDPLTDSLVSAVCLWGSRLSRDTPLHAFEEHLLTKAVQGVSTSLFLANSGDRGHAILRVIQADLSGISAPDA
ncbi:uncharacterized protein PHACADRAFT_197729 [Phanerochaete carnosa HHB-10118-sp]|uniref:Zn(2)-C6 fungal-type domain-containing protein n=1 Tax=Phanerochaete carnosa (strain HHB-10118-sp) TaxID=650164 RepID=K5W2J1_PHACS|nr:uncharacterized protein PHACADRAFT_197729 [Phanerochaete carnosa HHB-10118-sp]EKM53300.1 hypothetical protein PHACADRAFT_197729 [Phanerochaete carnosa HHB-10118-sp]